MVLYNPSGRVPLIEFGIEIPVLPDRAAQVLAGLRADADLAARESEWLVGPDGSELSEEDVLRVHSPAYTRRVFGPEVDQVMIEVFELIDDRGNYHRYNPANARRPLSDLFGDWKRWMAGSYQVGKEALVRQFCFFLGGGAHHGHYDFGHGFCIFNDIVIAIRRLQAEDRIRTAWVIDVDAHKGDGTAALTDGDPSITTLSVHMGKGWPLDLPEFDDRGVRHPAFTPSDIDVPINPGESGDYLPRLEAALDRLDGYTRPDIAYVVDGADPYEHDELPSTAGLALTLDQMLERDLMIHGFLRSRGIPQAYLMSGGYGRRAWEPYPPFIGRVLRERL